MNREALVQLRRVVLEAPEDRFDMRYFGECNTAHCAAGWAAQDAWFKENCPIPQKRGMAQWHDVARVFGLSERWSDDLFACNISQPENEISKEDVIDNIDRILGGEAPIPYDYNPDYDDEDDE